MSQQTNIHFTLKLCPIVGKAPAASAPEENWLDNSDEGIFSHLDQSEAKTDIHQVIENISIDSNRRVFKLNQLEIQYSANGFVVQHEGKQTVLMDGDVIAIGQQYLEVIVGKQQIVNNPAPSSLADAPAHPIDDIWQMDLSPAQAYSHASARESLTASAIIPHTHNAIQDPLSFLYGSSRDAVSPSSYSDNQAYLGASSLDSSLSLLPSVDSHAPYTPAPTPIESSRRDEYRYPSENTGNVLRDLGINESPLTLASQNAKQSPLTQQAPMDMIDELLYDDHEEVRPAQNYHPNAYPRPYAPQYALPPAQSQRTEPSAWQSFKKKLFG